MENLLTVAAEDLDLATNKPPAFQVYARDEYLGSMHLTAEEFAAHWRATLWSWTEGPLPLDEAQRARVCVVRNARRFRKIWSAISPLWVEGPTGYANASLEERRGELDRFLALQREKAAAGGRARAAARGQVTGTAGTIDAVAERMVNELPAARAWATPRGLPPPASSSALSEDQDRREEQPPAPQPVEQPMADQVNMAVLTRLAHDVWSDLDTYPDDAPEIQPGNIGTEATERLKTAAAKHDLVYDARAVTSALDSAAWQRSHESPVEAGERLARAAMAGTTDWVTRDDFNGRMFAAINRSRPAPRDQAWRETLCGLVFRDNFLRTLPKLFELQFAPDSSVSRLKVKR